MANEDLSPTTAGYPPAFTRFLRDLSRAEKVGL